MWRRNATIAASSDSVKTVERGSVGPVFICSPVARFRHFATVFGLMPSSWLNRASPHSRPKTDDWRSFDLHSLYFCSDGVLGRGPSITNLSHSAPFISAKGSHHHVMGSNR